LISRSATDRGENASDCGVDGNSSRSHFGIHPGRLFKLI
jgi:hypothetical protein